MVLNNMMQGDSAFAWVDIHLSCSHSLSLSLSTCLHVHMYLLVYTCVVNTYVDLDAHAYLDLHFPKSPADSLRR